MVLDKSKLTQANMPTRTNNKNPKNGRSKPKMVEDHIIYIHLILLYAWIFILYVEIKQLKRRCKE